MTFQKSLAASLVVLTVAAGASVSALQRGTTRPGSAGGSDDSTAPRASSQTWTGTISDAMCKGMHNGKDAKQCTADCVKNGSKYVFVVDGKTVYNIDNQKFKDLPKFAGDTAVVTGTLQNDTITITKIAAPKNK